MQTRVGELEEGKMRRMLAELQRGLGITPSDDADCNIEHSAFKLDDKKKQATTTTTAAVDRSSAPRKFSVGSAVSTSSKNKDNNNSLFEEIDHLRSPSHASSRCSSVRSNTSARLTSATLTKQRTTTSSSSRCSNSSSVRAPGGLRAEIDLSPTALTSATEATTAKSTEAEVTSAADEEDTRGVHREPRCSARSDDTEYESVKALATVLKPKAYDAKNYEEKSSDDDEEQVSSRSDDDAVSEKKSGNVNDEDDYSDDFTDEDF